MWQKAVQPRAMLVTAAAQAGRPASGRSVASVTHAPSNQHDVRQGRWGRSRNSRFLKSPSSRTSQRKLIGTSLPASTSRQDHRKQIYTADVRYLTRARVHRAVPGFGGKVKSFDDASQVHARRQESRTWR
jgi:hypothetical protein